MFSKAIEKIKCFFCRIGGFRRDRLGSYCLDSRRIFFVMFGYFRFFFFRELKEISSIF